MANKFKGDLELALQLAEAGETAKEIAARTGICLSSAYRIIKNPDKYRSVKELTKEFPPALIKQVLKYKAACYKKNAPFTWKDAFKKFKVEDYSSYNHFRTYFQEKKFLENEEFLKYEKDSESYLRKKIFGETSNNEVQELIKKIKDVTGATQVTLKF